MDLRRRFLVWRALGVAAVLLSSLPCLHAVDGTYTVTENWSAKFTYSNWGMQRFSGTRQFSGRQTGTVIVTGGGFELLDQTGLKHDPPADSRRAIRFNGSRYTINGGPVMPYILAGSSLFAVLHLSGFAVKVALVDGEIPTFSRFNSYDTTGTSLSALMASGDMVGGSLTITVSSSSVWTRAPFAPVILVDPVSQTVPAGADAVISVVAEGNPLPSYQWQRKAAGSSGWSNVNDGLHYAGARGATLTIRAVSLAMTGDQYRCRISNSRGNVITSVVDLTITPPLSAPEILAGPNSRLIVSNQETVVFSVEATGSNPLEYQWRFQGSNIPGATGPALTIGPVTAAHVGHYDVVVSNAAGSASSEVAKLAFEVPVVLAGIRPSPDGLQLTLRFGAGELIELESSTDLVEWHPLTLVQSPDGVADYVLQSLDASPVGFLRARRME